MDFQSLLPAALAATHNFILKHDPTDHKLPGDSRDPAPGAHVDAEDAHVRDIGELAAAHTTTEEYEEALQKRDSIAEQMWQQYQQVLAERSNVVDEWLNDSEEEMDD
ncbi:hypothetical protein AAF712_013300 [Marasmius tenuissimus]|uniref:Uncharacterized protein n=1 Tax=Marasmius tenuissimus TaxID=585030 RepID=A0ABR2ZEE2_9AGAR